LVPDNIELQQCKLCQHSIDTPPDRLKVNLVTVEYYLTPAQTLLTQDSETSLYIVPQLRAPPSQ
jgi:hypothetical protein